MKKTAGEVAVLLAGEVVGNKNEVISGLNAFELAGPGDLTFAGSKTYLEKLEETKASVVLVDATFTGKSSKTLIKVRSAKEAFIGVVCAIYRPEHKTPGVHPSAVVSPTAKIGKNVYLGPNVVVDDNAVIGDDTQVWPGTYIGARTTVGAQTVIYPNVSIYHEIRIGSRVIIHSGAVIGADGFGFYEKDGRHNKIPQTGNVIIEDDVEIGANDTIDRATFGSTIIGRGTKLDDMVHVAHNCVIQQNVIMCGQSGVAGSTVIEDNVMVGAQAGIKDHIRLKKRSLIGATAAVKEGTEEGQYVLGMPAIPALEFGKRHATLGKLTEKLGTIMKLVKEYEAKKGSTKK